MMTFNQLEGVHRLLDNLKSEPTHESPKTACGLDTLYYYVKLDYDNYTLFFRNVLLKRTLENDNCLKLKSLNYEKQFTFFELLDYTQGDSPITVCTIGFKNLNNKDNLESIKIQMSSFFMNDYGYEKSVEYVHNYLRGLGLNPLSTKVSRVDLNTYFLGHDFSYLRYDLFSTRSKKNKTYNNGSKFTGFTLGARSNDSVFLRIYDKNNELKDNQSNIGYLDTLRKEFLISKKFINKYAASFELSNYPLWNVEFELKREVLRKYNIDTIQDLWEKVDSVHKHICSNSFRLLDSPKTNSNASRKQNSFVWDILVDNYKVFHEGANIDKEKLKVYRQDESWLINRLEEFLSHDFNCDSAAFEKVKELKEFLSSKT